MCSAVPQTFAVRLRIMPQVVLGKFGLCLKLISEIGGLEWSVCSEILEPPCPMTRDGDSKISEQTNHSKPPISLISFRHKPNFPNTSPKLLGPKFVGFLPQAFQVCASNHLSSPSNNSRFPCTTICAPHTTIHVTQTVASTTLPVQCEPW
jgi:hypothetical protein